MEGMEIQQLPNNFFHSRRSMNYLIVVILVRLKTRFSQSNQLKQVLQIAYVLSAIPLISVIETRPKLSLLAFTANTTDMFKEPVEVDPIIFQHPIMEFHKGYKSHHHDTFPKLVTYGGLILVTGCIFGLLVGASFFLIGYDNIESGHLFVYLLIEPLAI